MNYPNLVGRRPINLVVRLSGVRSIDNLNHLLADIQNRLPISEPNVRDILETIPLWFKEIGTADGITCLLVTLYNGLRVLQKKSWTLSTRNDCEGEQSIGIGARITFQRCDIIESSRYNGVTLTKLLEPMP